MEKMFCSGVEAVPLSNNTVLLVSSFSYALNSAALLRGSLARKLQLEVHLAEVSLVSCCSTFVQLSVHVTFVSAIIKVWL